jgi:hypothetical protein
MNIPLAFNGASLRNVGTLSTTPTIETKTISVLTALQDDYANRTARGNRTQYRLAFTTPSDFDDMADYAAFDGQILNVRYFLP